MSNCFFSALYIRWRIGGSLSWKRPTWAAPWGHWRVICKNRVLSYSTDNDLAWWRQLCFEGKLKITYLRGAGGASR